MPWDSFKDLLQEKAGKQKIYRQAQETLVLIEANKIMVNLLPAAENMVQAIYLSNGLLTVAVLADEFIPELDKIKIELFKQLNTKFGQAIVKEWRFLT